MELKFYSDLLSVSRRAVELFMKINDIPYVDMQANAIRLCVFHAVASIQSFIIVYDCIMYNNAAISRTPSFAAAFMIG